jgi:hypothetical protein
MKTAYATIKGFEVMSDDCLSLWFRVHDMR